jgi:hypothetical protein
LIRSRYVRVVLTIGALVTLLYSIGAPGTHGL